MKKSKFTEAHIAVALRWQAEQGTQVRKVCRKLGISPATFPSWKKEYGGMGVLELRRFKRAQGGEPVAKATARRPQP